MLYGFFAGAACYADDVALLAPSHPPYGWCHYCEEFVGSWGLIFNASKTHLICFGSQSSTSCSANIHFYTPFSWCCGASWSSLRHDLSDSNDILCNVWDLIRKANLILYTFSDADTVLSLVCCSLTVCHYMVLPFGSSHALPFIQISFNNILRHIWHRPLNCHTRILHFAARLPSLFNVIISWAASLLSSTLSCPSLIFRKVFGNSSLLAYTHTGYNLCQVAYMPSSTTRRMVCVPKSSTTSDPCVWALKDNDLNEMINIICTN